ncbi:hypothetical protein [Actinoplanes friuliensis]|uniref:Lipoprotein n=1 Tax=Actinoplanes friuliensis DSM 7358 TaxID=1246995 RepID=U5W806_9ACTN|nr:hypothetical protein [Actinoplanes friuliensis]AGZ45142.1 hypothetical protein AFR_34420 [Actinoplanes friuliensis DSM 7358]
MKIHRSVPTVLVLATAALTGLTGCGAIGATASPAASSIPAGMGGTEDLSGDSTASPDPSSSATSSKKHKKPAKSAPTHSSPAPTYTTHAPKPQGPRVVSFKVVQKPKCAEGTAVFRAEAVPLIIKWKITGADSAALSVDDPTGTPGTYGPVAQSGTEEFTFSCGGPVGSIETHTYAIYTVGGGHQKHKTLKVSAKVLDHGTEVG